MTTYHDILATRLKEQLSTEKYCDIEIYVGEKKFCGHKCILAALSPLLEENIQIAEKEYFNEHIPHKSKIELFGISDVGFSALFDFMYCGKLKIDETNANDVTVAAMILGVQPAINACVGYKRGHFQASSLPVNHPFCASVPALTSDETDPKNMQITDVVSCVPSIHLPKTEAADISTNFAEVSPSKTVPPEMDDCPNHDFTSLPSIFQSFEAMKNDPMALPTLLSFNQEVSSSDAENNIPSHSNAVLPMVQDDGIIQEETDENGEQVWRCKICNKFFRKLSYLKYVHIRLHNGSRPFVCNLCGKQFATKGNLLQHHKVHLARNGVLPFKCKHCKRAFALKGNCQKHEKTHTKPYRCEFCPRVFALKHDCLQHHLKHHTGTDASTIGLKCEKCLFLFPVRFGKEYMNHKCIQL